MRPLRIVARLAGYIALGLVLKGVMTAMRESRPEPARPAALASSPSSVAPAPAEDRLGIGYRVKSGVFESAVSGLRIRPVDNLTLVGRDEEPVPAAGPLVPEVTLLNAGEALRIVVESVRSADPAGQIQRMRRIAEIAWEAMGAVRDPEDPWRLDLLGETRTFETTRSSDSVVRDTFFSLNGRAYRATVEHAPNKAPAARATAARLFQSIEALPAIARSQLRKDLTDTSDLQAEVSEDSVVRGRSYSSFRHGIGWTAPAGFWRFYARAPEQLGAGIVFGATDDENGNSFAVNVVPPALSPKEGLNLMAKKFRSGSATPISERPGPDGTTFFVQAGIEVSDTFDGAVHLATWRHRDTTFFVRMESTFERQSDSDATFQRVLSGFRVAVPATMTQHESGAYLDHRMGFSFREPHGWHFSVSPTKPEEPVGTDASWTLDGVGNVTVSAAFHPGSQGYGGALGDVVYTGLVNWAKTEYPASVKEHTETLAGRRARHLTFVAAGKQVDLLVLDRNGVAYLLRSEGGDGRPYELVRSGFALLK